MPHDGGDSPKGPDIDGLVQRIRAEARERFPEDVHEEATRWHAPPPPDAPASYREPLRARLKRNRWIGRMGRLAKGLLLAGRTRVQAAEAEEAAQAALREITQLKSRLAGVEAQAAEIQPLADRLAGNEGELSNLSLRQDEMTQRQDEMTQRQDEMTQRQDEMTQRQDEMTQRQDEMTQRQDAAETQANEAHALLEARLDKAWADFDARIRGGEAQAARAERGLRVARADLRARSVALDRLQGYLEGRSDIAEAAPAPTDPAVSSAEMEAFFLAFDEGLRGNAAQIAEQLAAYLPDLYQANAGREDRPVLDLGCGRGTWLRVMREDGIVCRGIDLNRALVDAAAGEGLDVSVDDALSALRAAPDGTLGAVTAFHLAEHLPFETLYAVFSEAQRALAPGGLLLMETPNPENGYVGTHTFYHDPTHSNPLTPALVQFIADYHGYAEVEIRRVHPYPEAGRLPDGVPANDRLNGWLMGPQDFALLARTADTPRTG